MKGKLNHPAAGQSPLNPKQLLWCFRACNMLHLLPEIEELPLHLDLGSIIFLMVLEWKRLQRTEGKKKLILFQHCKIPGIYWSKCHPKPRGLVGAADARAAFYNSPSLYHALHMSCFIRSHIILGCVQYCILHQMHHHVKYSVFLKIILNSKVSWK